MREIGKAEDQIVLLQSQLGALGLVVLGYFEPTSCELPEGFKADEPAIGIVLASPGVPMWDAFSQSSEFGDKQLNPMDRWTRRQLDKLSIEHNGYLALPFQKPYFPFQSWAIRAGGLKASPINLLIHPDYGLWFGLRGALFFSDNAMIDAIKLRYSNGAKRSLHPCDHCRDKPCLTTCPVDPFKGTGLDREACFSHLDSGEKPDCSVSGCAARNACPIGVDHRYRDDQLAFHMRAFRGA